MIRKETGRNEKFFFLNLSKAMFHDCPEILHLTLTSSASDMSLLALLLSPSDCLSERTSMDGLLEFSSTNVLQSV